jgi:hypothetical protein
MMMKCFTLKIISMNKKDRKSDYVCVNCGVSFLTEEQKHKARICTFFIDKCGLCGKEDPVTHIRNYNYLNKKDEKVNKAD